MSNTKFAFDLFRECIAERKDRNVVLAPPSVTKALTMVSMGARGKTAEEIHRVLNWYGEEEPLKSLASSTSSLKENAAGNDTTCRMVDAQRIYVDKSFTLKPEFVSAIQEIFASEAVTADFRNNPEGEREIINSWMMEQTQGKIQDPLPDGSVDSSTDMLLAQAVTYTGTWKYLFNPNFTQPGTFYSPYGDKQVPMMHQESQLDYSEEDGDRAVELPYLSVTGNDPPSGDLSMVVVLQENPKKKFGYHTLIKLLCRATVQEVDLKMPRFRNETTMDLKQPLIRVGMQNTFGNEADFSGLVEDGQLTFSSYVHTVIVETNEEGTEATKSESYQVAADEVTADEVAADEVTADEVAADEVAAGKIADKTKTEAMAMCSTVIFYVDHPFLYYIINRTADGQVNILVSGRVTDP